MLDIIKESVMGLNWVDFGVLATLSVGVLVGRKRGMSLELLDVLQWLLIVLFAGMICVPVGSLIQRTANIGLLGSRVSAYLFVVIVFMVVFGFARKMIGAKLVGSDTFGALEYYLGMVAGAVRFACILVVAMAFLNAKQISEVERAAFAKTQKETLGTMTIPSLGSLQDDVFKKSLSGRSVRRYLGAHLIPPTSVSNDPLQNSMGRQKDRLLDDIIGGGRR